MRGPDPAIARLRHRALQQHGLFDLVHLEAIAAAIGSMGIRVANWYPAPQADLTPSQLADAYASLALRMTGARPQ